jgi:2-keto-3-deoxy-L-rhamnonate aldolase RhmA
MQHAPMRQIAMVRRVFDVGLMVILWPRVETHGKPLLTL